MIKFRDYQTDIIEKASKIISRHRFVYLAMEVRTGKTLTSLGIAERIGMTKVLFITKKKAISSIEHDYELLNPGFRLTVINYESLHKLPTRGGILLLLMRLMAWVLSLNQVVELRGLRSLSFTPILMSSY